MTNSIAVVYDPDVRMIDLVIENMAVKGAKTHTLLRKEHVVGRDAAVSSLNARGVTIHAVEELTEGTACTLLLAREAIDNEDALLVANSDQYVDFNVEDFVADCIRRDLDGSILVFRDPTMDPKWSFAKLDASGLVTEVAEKKPISDLATVGIYLFRRGDAFVASTIDMIVRNDRVNNEFYTCPVYNYMIAKGARIAGTNGNEWAPAFAGATGLPGRRCCLVIPAKAGTHNHRCAS